MKTKIGVFFGGRSTEHEISVISALQTINAIDKTKYDIYPIYITKDGRWLTGNILTEINEYKDIQKLESACREVYMKTTYNDYNVYFSQPKGLFNKVEIYAKLDLAFPVLHGSNGEDGVFQGVLDNIGIPYVGCDVIASALGMDKIFMKQVLQANDIPVVPYIWFIDKDWISHEDVIVKRIEQSLGYPVIIKPANLGSSVGIKTAHDADSLKRSVLNAIKYSSRIIVERLLTDMKEINCSVLGNAERCEASILEEPMKTGELLSYEDKYMGGSKGSEGMAASSKRIPAELDSKTADLIRSISKQTFQSLGCSGVSRVDVMIECTSNNVYVNEINTIPGSLSYYLWEFTGITFTALTDKLISLAFQRSREQKSKITSYSLNIFNTNIGSGSKGTKMGAKTGRLK